MVKSSHGYNRIAAPCDWICTICGCVNFARRTSCFQVCLNAVSVHLQFKFQAFRNYLLKCHGLSYSLCGRQEANKHFDTLNQYLKLVFP